MLVLAVFLYYYYLFIFHETRFLDVNHHLIFPTPPKNTAIIL